MKMQSKLLAITMALLVSSGLCHGATNEFANEVKSFLDNAMSGDEGLADPRYSKKLDEIRSDRRDWEDALLEIIASGKSGRDVVDAAIYLLQLRGSLQQPRSEKVLAAYFKERVRQARARDKSDSTKTFLARTEIGGLATRFAKYGGRDLLLATLTEASSDTEQADPLLDEYTTIAIVDALMTKADARHVEGMQKLVDRTKNQALKQKLSVAIGKAKMP